DRIHPASDRSASVHQQPPGTIGGVAGGDGARAVVIGVRGGGRDGAEPGYGALAAIRAGPAAGRLRARAVPLPERVRLGTVPRRRCLAARRAGRGTRSARLAADAPVARARGPARLRAGRALPGGRRRGTQAIPARPPTRAFVRPVSHLPTGDDPALG